VFMTIFFSVWTGLHVYVFWRASSIPAITRHVSRKVLITTAAVLWTSIMLSRFFDNLGAEAIARLVELLGMTWLGILFLIFICLFAVDLVSGFGLLFRRALPSLRGGAFLTGMVLSAIALVQGLRPPVVHDYEVRIIGLPAESDGLVLAVISDLHIGALLDGQWLAARIAQVNALRPDLVIMLGDIFEGDSDHERQSSMVSLFRSISAPLGVWAVTGNHESHSGIDSTVRFFEESGIRMLRNSWSEVRPGLALGGVDDGGHHESSVGGNDPVRQTLAGKPSNTATVFLSHRPQRTEEAVNAGVSLMLCGHTHGGQIWPFSYVSGLVNPLVAGRYEVNGMPVIVCRGTGTWGPRMRLWSPNEIVRVTLRQSNCEWDRKQKIVPNDYSLVRE
jgi:predicted MPP superfamily phosphohydrolase